VNRTRRFTPIIPHILTGTTVVLGVSALLAVLHAACSPQQPGVLPLVAAWCITAAAVIDGIDGALARKLKSASPLGRQLDSLADLTAFGIAPPLLVYFRFLRHVPWAAPAAVIFVLAGAFRLARFSADSSHRNRGFFIGLPVTAGGGALAACVLFADTGDFHGIYGNDCSVLCAGGAVMLMAVHSVLMVSRIRFLTFTAFFFPGSLRIVRFLPAPAAAAAVALSPGPALLGLALLYDIVSLTMWRFRPPMNSDITGDPPDN
jgi:CDP-diacylglycerol--serine O-phosphatidyltransferase